MAIKHQDLKNLVIQEMLNESINNEGVADWLRTQSSKAFSSAGKALSGAGEKLKPGDPQIAKKLEKVGDFLQMAQRDKDITQLIMQTDLGKKVFSSQEKSLEEALGQDFVKMMKDKKVTPQEVEAFVAAMNKNKKAKQMLDGLGLDIEVSDQDIEAGKQQGAPADATAQTQAQPGQTPSQQEKPAGVKPPQQVPIFKATPDSKGDVLSMKLKPLLTKSNIKDSDLLLKQYLKMISNQLKANGIKLMEAKGDNLASQLSGFTSQTATGLKKGTEGPIAPGASGTAANVQKGSVDLFGPAVLLLKQTGLDQKMAVTLAKQIRDLTSKHLQKYGVNIPEKALRVPNPQQPAKPAAANAVTQQPQKKELGNIKSGEQPGTGFAAKGFDDNQKKQLVRTLASQGFKAEQVTKVVNTFSDWLKNRTNQQTQQIKEGAGSAQVRELVAQFAKETNLGMDEKLRTALVNAAIKIFGSPAQQAGPVQKQTSPAQKDAEVAAKMAGETNPNPSVDVPRTNSSTLPQPAEPVKFAPPVEDSTGKPISKAPAVPVKAPVAKAAKAAPAQAPIPEKYKAGLSDQQMKNVTAKAAKAFKTPEEAQAVATEFSDWLKEKASVKTMQELRSFLKEATEDELTLLFSQFLKEKNKKLTPLQKRGLLSAFSSTEQAPAESPQTSPEGEKGIASSETGGEEKKDEKEVKQSSHPIIAKFKKAIDLVNKIKPTDLNGIIKTANEMIETGQPAEYIVPPLNEPLDVKDFAGLVDTFLTVAVNGTLLTALNAARNPDTPSSKIIELYQTLKAIEEVINSMQNDLGGEGIFAGKFDIKIPIYGQELDLDRHKVMGTDDTPSPRIVGSRTLFKRINKEIRPAGVLLGKINPEIAKALGTTVKESVERKESLKRILMEEIFNAIVGKNK